MNEGREHDPLDSLRAVDPVDDNRLSSASLVRIRARVSEDVMTTPSSPARRFGSRVAGLGMVAAAAAAFALVLFVGRPGAAPGLAPGSTVPGSSVGTGTMSCIEPYAGPASAARRGLAFDGTVTALSGNTATFTVNKAYRGPKTSTVTLDAEGMTGTTVTSAGGPTLIVGQRYLVAGEDHWVWSCGYTQPYDAGVAAAWQAAIGG
jgi:hypothetical protein